MFLSCVGSAPRTARRWRTVKARVIFLTAEPDMTEITPPNGLRTPARRLGDVLGFVASVLLLAGALTGGFLCFSIWGTALETHRHQQDLREQFEGTAPANVSVDEPDAAESVQRFGFRTPSAHATPHASRPIGVAVSPPQFKTAVDGAPIGVLDIDSIGVSWVVVDGIGVDDLRKGPGHFPDTPLPGQPGNSAIAGHRTTYGAPFSKIDQISVGDRITLTTENGVFTYVALETVIVDPDDYSEISSRFPELSTLSLVSCHPRFSTRQRIIVHAVLDRDAEKLAEMALTDVSGSPAANSGPSGDSGSVNSTMDAEATSVTDSTRVGSELELPANSDDLDESIGNEVSKTVTGAGADVSDRSTMPEAALEQEAQPITWVRSPVAPVWSKTSLVVATTDAIPDGLSIEIESFDTGINLSTMTILRLLMWTGVAVCLMVAVAVTAQFRRGRILAMAVLSVAVLGASFFMFSALHAVLPAGS